MATRDPREIALYHITHVENLASVIATGLACDTAAQSGGVFQVEIGDRSVKARRRTMPIHAGPGGVASDYVPFYFAPRSPMLFVISRGGVPEYQDGEEPLVHLVTDIGMISDLGNPYVFSEGNCASAITEVFDDLDDLERVDWAIMHERYWNDTLEDGDRMRRRMAEFLVHQSVPWSAVREVVVKNDATAELARQILVVGGSAIPVVVRRDWYYG